MDEPKDDYGLEAYQENDGIAAYTVLVDEEPTNTPHGPVPRPYESDW